MYAEPSLCYSAFPICNVNSNKPPHKICREDCELLENVLCRLEYALAKSHPLIGQQLSLPDCEELPHINSEQSQGCLRMGIQKQTQGTHATLTPLIKYTIFNLAAIIKWNAFLL